MEEKRWKYQASIDEPRYPYLHDCIAEEILRQGSELIMTLPDGFWILADDPRNPYGEIHKTGRAQVVVSLGWPEPVEDVEKAIGLEVFHRHYLRGVGFTTCSYPKTAELIEDVNRGRCKLEFITKYRCYNQGYMVQCCIHTKRKWEKCYISLECRDIRFFWDEVLKDRVW